MDGQESDGGVQRSAPMSEQEMAELQRFLGSYTAADRPGVSVQAGEKPDNVRPLTRKRPHREVE